MTVYPGPPRPVAVGSPPWITNPGTMRWKIVPSKKCLRTRDANDDVVHGESWTSSRNANSPRFVSTSTSCGVFGSSKGKVTCAPVVGQRFCVFVAVPCPPPQRLATVGQLAPRRRHVTRCAHRRPRALAGRAHVRSRPCRPCPGEALRCRAPPAARAARESELLRRAQCEPRRPCARRRLRPVG